MSPLWIVYEISVCQKLLNTYILISGNCFGQLSSNNRKKVSTGEQEICGIHTWRPLYSYKSQRRLREMKPHKLVSQVPAPKPTKSTPSFPLFPFLAPCSLCQILIVFCLRPNDVDLPQVLLFFFFNFNKKGIFCP